eukprot:gene5464-5520_t
MMLTLFAMILAIVIAVPLAFVAALRENRWPDLLIRAVFQVGLSTPIFYVGLLLLTVLAAWARLFPVGGYGEGFGEHLWHLFLPSLTLAFSFAAVLMRNVARPARGTMRAKLPLLAGSLLLAIMLAFAAVFARPNHAYTQALLRAMPGTGAEGGRLVPIPGMAPRLDAPAPGCAFTPRCTVSEAKCASVRPALLSEGDRAFACYGRDRLRFPGTRGIVDMIAQRARPVGDARRRFNRAVQMVFQDPYASLNPRMTVEATLGEALRVHRIVPESEIAGRVLQLLDLVQLPATAAK